MTDHNQHKDSISNLDPLRLSFYATPEHECSYISEQQAITLFADPEAELDSDIYSTLSQYGFRRSGKHIYRPSCPTCSACIPVRVPVNDFTRNRNQRRVWKQNHDLEVDIVSAEFRQEQHDLYNKYMQSRHADGGMNDPDPDKYMEFLTSPWSVTRFIEFRLEGTLVCVAVIDLLKDGISSVYTFFDPELTKRSLGTLAILWTIEYARITDLPCLYLGYLITDCQKMSYKSHFKPQQHFIQGHWITP